MLLQSWENTFWVEKTEHQKIQRILEELKETKNISNIKTAKKPILNTRQVIANVFAEFYEILYEGEEDDEEKRTESRSEEDERIPDQHIPIPEFTKIEFEDAIDRLKKGKAKNSRGVRAEQLKNCSDNTKERIRMIFNEIIRQEHFTPKSWGKIRIQVIYKKEQRRCRQLQANMQLASTIQTIATVLYARLAPSLHKIQPPDQGGFRPNHRTDDHLMVCRVLEQRCREWSVPLYISTIDFTKAFDRKKHSALWSSMQHYGVEPAYIRLLQRLCSHQEGTVLTDKESDTFPIKRDKAAGPIVQLSLQHSVAISLQDDLKRWQEKQKGIRLSDKKEDCLTNLRFADDVLLFSTSLDNLREMLCEFKTSTEAVGLGIHPDKTNILSNQDKEKAKEITVENIKIEVLAKGDSARYLGQKVTFEEQETEEIKSRLKAAWAAFHKYRQEITSKDYRLCHRLRLFGMVITPTLAYASGTWTLSQKHERMIRTAQRKMLRLIVQTKRRQIEKQKRSCG